MSCLCQNIPEHLKIPPMTVLSTYTVIQLRAYANVHNIGPNGQSGVGHSKWRGNASTEALRNALTAHQHGVHITPADPLTDERVQRLAENLFALNETLSPEAVTNRIIAEVYKEVQKLKGSVTSVVVTSPSGVTDVGRQHKLFPVLVQIIGLGEHVFCVGPAGSGKTEAAMAAARSLGREFEVISFGPQTTQSELAGYRDATGTYRDTAIRRAFQFGKILICDEMDAANPGVLAFLNAALSNAYAGFPDGAHERHRDFTVIALGNTYGTGADMQYIGRSQLDAATLDRFTVLDWGYDEEFERDLALNINPLAMDWVKKVQSWRANMLKHKIRHVISPRASIKGATLLKAGFKPEDLEKMLVFKGLNKEGKDKITQEGAK